MRCLVTGNQCGTDTWFVGSSCKCAACQRWLEGPVIFTAGKEPTYDYRPYRNMMAGNVALAAAPNTYADDMDAAYIAQQVIQYGKSTGWAPPTEPHAQHLAQQIERELAKFNIGITDHSVGTWSHKPGGSHVFK
jgi:hypothetical protein